jgi:predicted transcriptional regulator
MQQMDIHDFIKQNITILDYIPFGKDNAVRRSTLADLTKLTDREVRKILKNLIQYGVIANYQNGGYYRTKDITEIETAIKIEQARLKSVEHTIEQLEEYKRRLGGA